MIPAQLLTLTLYMCTFIRTKFLCVYSSAAFKSSLSQSRCSSEPKHFHRRVQPPPPPPPPKKNPIPLMLAMLVFLLDTIKRHEINLLR